MGFHVLTFAMPLMRCEKQESDRVVIEGNLISQPYMDEVLRPVVLHFLCQNQDKNTT